MLDIEIVEHKEGRTTKINGFESEGLIILPIMGGIIDERVILLVKTANDFGKSVATTFNEIGIIANPGDDPAEILAAWEKVDKRK